MEELSTWNIPQLQAELYDERKWLEWAHKRCDKADAAAGTVKIERIEAELRKRFAR